MGTDIFNKTIIAACESNNLDNALKSKSSAVIYMNADINSILSAAARGCFRHKPIFIHMDLLKGLNSDKEALHFLKKQINPFGIVSTKSNIIRSAKKEGLFTLQRIFLIDTKSFNNSLEAIRENKPDAVEIMPAIAPSIVQRYNEHFSKPIILGGLISEEGQITKAFEAGANAVSLSNSRLWDFQVN